MDRIITGWKPKKDDLYRFSRAQDGNDLLVSSERDICIFTKLYRRLQQPAAVEPKAPCSGLHLPHKPRRILEPSELHSKIQRMTCKNWTKALGKR